MLKNSFSKLGKDQKNLLTYLESHPGWHTLSKDQNTRRIIKKLLERNLIVSNRYKQYRIL